MRKKRIITTVADYFEIIDCQSHSGERVNWSKEDRIRDRIAFSDSGMSSDDKSMEFEDSLHRESGLLDSVRSDPWTGETHLYSFRVWYTYQLKIGYTYRDRSYESHAEYETETGRLPDVCKLEVTFCTDDPQHILSVSEHRDSIWEDIICFLRLLFGRR